MSNELEEKILRFLKKIQDTNEKAILHARQSTPDTLSEILLNIQSIIEKQGLTINELKKGQEDHIILHSVNDKKTEDSLNEINTQVSSFEEKLNTIYPSVIDDIDNAKFWKKLRNLLKNAGGGIIWTVTVITATVIFSNYGRDILKSWLGI